MPRLGQLHVLVHSEAVENRWRLELSADAECSDVHIGHVGDLFALHENPAGGHAGFATDHIAERRFARAVGPDDDAEIVVVDAERVDIERLEAVEDDRDFVEVDDVAVDGVVEIDPRCFDHSRAAHDVLPSMMASGAPARATAVACLSLLWRNRHEAKALAPMAKTSRRYLA